jgi:hypothetical protein
LSEFSALLCLKVCAPCANFLIVLIKDAAHDKRYSHHEGHEGFGYFCS